MYGVDTVAHLTAVKQKGTTIGVLGYGFGVPYYPREQEKVADAILESGGCLITEYPPWQTPTRYTFPKRNRIVSGLSLGVVVTEAAVKSGSKITARLAAEQGREVFAVPGPIDSPYSEGTKELINLGATLVSSASDILSQLQHQL
ncbi:DNA-protecting protein DprA, partial [Candidatus Woesebacteria bacterium]|nr:DNA-protecting protein DprA [Candidatus Woesebacteria bacterium]